MDASQRRPPSTGRYCMQCGRAEYVMHKGLKCRKCGSEDLKFGIYEVQWAILVTKSDANFLRSLRIDPYGEPSASPNA